MLFSKCKGGPDGASLADDENNDVASPPATSTVQPSPDEQHRRVNSYIEAFVDSCTRKWSTALQDFRFQRSEEVEEFKKGLAGKVPSSDEINAFGERLAAEERAFQVEFNKIHKERVEKFRSKILKKCS
jgi:hypothetical protein